MARKDVGSLANLAGTNVVAGDTLPQHVMVVDANGNPVAAASGGTASTDKAAFTASGTAGTPSMGGRDDVATSTLAEGEIGVIRATQYRALHVNLRDASGTELSVGGGVQYTDLDVDSTPTGNVILALNGSTVSALLASTGVASSGSLGLLVREVPSTRVQEVWQTASILSSVTAVANSTTSVTLKAANPTRKGLSIYNDCSSATLYVNMSTTAYTGAYSFPILPTAYYEMPAPMYGGIVYGTWGSSQSGGFARVTELQ